MQKKFFFRRVWWTSVEKPSHYHSDGVPQSWRQHLLIASVWRPCTTETPLKGKVLQFKLSTYNFDSMARGGGQWPRAGLLTGISVGPVGAADCARYTANNMITSRWKRRQKKETDIILPHFNCFHVLFLGGKWKWNLNSSVVFFTGFQVSERYLPCSPVCCHAAWSRCDTDRCSFQRCWHTHAGSLR